MHSPNWYEEKYKEQRRRETGLPSQKEVYVKLVPIQQVVKDALNTIKRKLK